MQCAKIVSKDNSVVKMKKCQKSVTDRNVFFAKLDKHLILVLPVVINVLKVDMEP